MNNKQKMSVALEIINEELEYVKRDLEILIDMDKNDVIETLCADVESKHLLELLRDDGYKEIQKDCITDDENEIEHLQFVKDLLEKRIGNNYTILLKK